MVNYNQWKQTVNEIFITVRSQLGARHVRVVFPDKHLWAACNRRLSLLERWGDAADDVELALCALRAARTVNEFAGFPNVTQEDDLVFNAKDYAVHLDLASFDGDNAAVAVIELRVEVGDQ